MEFHQKMQDKESVEELGLDLQRLARKAYPGMGKTEFDRMLKGKFYQSLNGRGSWGFPNWMNLLRPCMNDQARMLEMHDQQYTATVQARDGKAKGASHTEKTVSQWNSLGVHCKPKVVKNLQERV